MLKFIGIGAQKSGTTWLANNLEKHPSVNIPFRKEHHYWNNAFPELSIERYLNRFNKASLVEGEITPAYAFLPISVIEKIKEVSPEIKLIYCLRNPVDRAWSSAKMACQRAEMTMEEASDQWFKDHFNSKGSQQRGDYKTSIVNWLSVFPREQLLLLRFEDIANNPELVLNNCFQHLGVSSLSKQDMADFFLQEKIFLGNEYQLQETLKQHLLELYLPIIEDLESYLDWDLSIWKR